jgi:hypothetical protein
MARRPKAAPRDAGRSRDRHVAFLAYQLGFTEVCFPGRAASVWRRADVEDPVPPEFRADVGELADVTRRLAPLIEGGGGGPRAEQVAVAAERAWESLERSWGGDLHRAHIAWREEQEPEYECTDGMMKGSPFREAAWEELRRAVEAFSARLPGPVAAWVRLGSAVAAVFLPRDGGSPRLSAIAAVQNLLSEMLPEPLLAGLPLDLSCASREPVARLHEQLWKRLTDGSADGGTATNPAAGPASSAACADEGEPPAVILDKRTREVAAVALLIAEPNMTVRQIAKETGFNRTSLYRIPEFQRALKARGGGPSERLRGKTFRDREGNTYVDGIDKTKPSEGVD